MKRSLLATATILGTATLALGWDGGGVPAEGIGESDAIVVVEPGAELPAPPETRSEARDEATTAEATGATCLSFKTIAQGQYSGFGDYCSAGSPFDAPEADLDSLVKPPCYAKVARPAFEAVIRDECTWLDFWSEHVSNVFPPPPAPAVDFDRFAVIAVISGTRPNGCYGMEIRSITKDKCGVKVRVRERVPCPGEACTLALTNNYHFVKICKDLVPFETPLCFEHKNENVLCSLGILCASPLPQTAAQ